MYAILFLLFLVEAVHAPARARLSRDEIIRMLLIEGFPYQLLCFLVAIFDIIILSLRTLKRSLRRQHEEGMSTPIFRQLEDV